MKESAGSYSHPDASVRHSYPLVIEQAGFGTAFGLMLKTLPYAMARFGILVAYSFITIAWLIITFGGGVFLGSAVHPWLGMGWMLGGLGLYGYLWWFLLRYFLYLLKAGHIAVLTELITNGSIGNGNEGMFAYGKRIVTERFGEVNILFAVDALIKGVVRMFNRSLDFLANLLPIPGLQSLMAIVNAIVRAATTYIDETIFSYNLARGDENPWRSSKDALIYYAQNSKEILKTAVYVVILDKVLTVFIWIVMLAPAFLLLKILPEAWAPGGFIGGLVIAALFASNVRQAFLKPMFLVMVMTKFHVVIRNQAIHPEWDTRLSGISSKFQTLKDIAIAFQAGRPASP
ncbi:MAG: hypothetical protein ABIP02_08810 [Arenimonas sp.]